nr:hypothetical protein [Tanacetum cinerariifolium]
VQGKLLSLATSVWFERGLSMHRTKDEFATVLKNMAHFVPGAQAKGNEKKKKIKSLSKSLDQLNAKVPRLSTALNQAIVLEAEKDEEILRLKDTPSEVQGELLSLATSVWFERGLSMHRTKDEFATVLKNMAHFVPGVQGRLAEASPLVAQTDYAFLNKI